MAQTSPVELVRRRFQETHGAQVNPAYGQILHVSRNGAAQAALGYRRAGSEALFLERYLDCPIEDCLSAALGRPIRRDSVIEIGNLAADDAFAMVSLWGSAANDLGAACEVAVATLTAPLRSMFARMSVPLHVLARATAERVHEPAAWGRYYDSDPRVCAGAITEAQRAIASFLARRRRAAA